MSEQTMTTTTARELPFEYDGTVVISIGVANLDDAIRWYGDMLGFELDYKLDQYGWCELRSPYSGITIGLGQSEEPKPGGATPTFTVKDIAAARSHLESHGVRFDGETYEIEGMVKLCTFYDPDDNSFMLAQNLEQPA